MGETVEPDPLEHYEIIDTADGPVVVPLVEAVEHVLVCSGAGCLAVLGSVVLPADHPDPSAALAGHLCEGCAPAHSAELEEADRAARARAAALEAIVDAHLAAATGQ